ncbi:unnamed protein product [Leptidea sinapis]|uniref:Protein krueppel n=1 Tax=Leptidea sinapis TaxID=189913 RepID=A0A5E4R3I5_9NEOP|nr:unnamed protein product [Leptidea sinapis]
MASENEVWKIENDLCRCCHNEGKFVNLVEPRIYLNQKEVYGEMLKDCFSIDIKPVPGVLCASTYTICDMCITQLRDAISFQKQILHCEKKFLDLYEKNAIKAKTEIIVKTEVDIEIEDDAKQNDSLMSFDEDDYSPEEDIEYELKIENEESDDDQPLVPKKRPKANPKPVPKPEPVSSKKPDSGGAKKKKEGVVEEMFIIKMEGEKRVYECTLCHRTYPKRGNFTQHYKHVHLKQRPKLISCHLCDVKVLVSQRPKHMEEAHGLPRPQCGACGKKFTFPFRLLQHQQTFHMGMAEQMFILKVVDGKEIFECSVCHRTYAKRAHFSQHFKHVHLKQRPKLRSCHLCDVKVIESQRPKHMEEAHGLPRPECGACGKKFTFPFRLLQHQQTFHMGERNFACEQCDMRFPTNQRLNRHMISHSESRPFSCNFCGKSFKSKKGLRVHTDIHIDRRRYKCTTCGEAFVQSSSLKYHVAKRHPDKHIVIKVEDDTKWFACSVCDYKVKTQRTLEEHIEAVHNYVKCEYCDEKVEMNRRLSHYEAVHDKVMEICDLCEHLFDGKQSVKT